MKLKKLLSIILAATVLLTTVQISFAFLLGAESETVYYVAQNGDDTTGTGSEEAPFATINKAQQVIADAETSGPINATIKVKGEAEFDGGVEHDGMITIEGVDETSALSVEWNVKNNASYRTVLKGATTLKNIGFISAKTGKDSKSTQIVTDGYEFVLDVDESAAQPQIDIGTMDENNTTKAENVTVKNWPGSSTSGLDLTLQGGVNTASRRVSAGLNLTVDGGYINLIEVNRTKYTGDVNLVFNNFFPTNEFIVKLGTNITFGGALQVIANNGITADVAGELITENATATDGVWFIYGAEGGKILPTADEGKFTVQFDEGYTAAKAINRADSSEVSVENGALELTAGTYDVVFQKASQDTPTVTEATYYVDTESGDDFENDGSTLGKAFKTITRAMQVAASLEYQTSGIVNATIYVRGNGADFDGGIEHKGMFTVKGYNNTSAVLTLTAEELTDSSGATLSGVALKGPMTFDTVTFPELTSSAKKYLVSGGHKLVLKNITAGKSKSYGYYIGYVDSTTPDTKEIVDFTGIGGEEGTVNNIIFGAVSNTNKTSAGLDFTLGSGMLSSISFLNGTAYTGDVSINLANFTADTKVSFVNNGATFGGAFQFIVNRGNKANLADDAIANIEAVTATGGKWIIYSDNSGCNLSATETAGVFKVVGGLYAKATDVTNNETVIYSTSDKTLTLPAGTYNVTYVMSLPSVGPVVPEPEKVEAEYYLDTVNGNDSNDGLTEDKPFKTLAKAQNTAKLLETSDNIVNVTVNLKGELAIDTIAHTGMLTIKGMDDTAITYFPNSNTQLNGPLTLTNVTAKQNGNHPVTNGHELVIDVKKKESNPVVYRIGNANGTEASYTDEKVTVIDNVKGSTGAPTDFQFGYAEKYSGNIDFLHKAGYIRKATISNTTFKGNVNLVFDSFTQRTDDKNQGFAEVVNENAVFEKAFQVVYNNGLESSIKTTKVFETDAVTAAEGKWIVYAENGALLRTTNLAGVYTIEGTVISATATNRNDSSKVYTSNEQNLLVIQEPGVYDVTFDTPDVVIPDDPEPTNIIEKTYYVNATTGNDENDGLTPEKALLTIKKAQELAASFEDTATDTAVNATINIAGGTLEFDGGVAHRGMFTIVGDGTKEGSTLKMKSASHGGLSSTTLKGPTTFRRVYMPEVLGGIYYYIVTNGYELVIDNSDTVAQRAVVQIGNSNETDTLKNEYVTVNGMVGGTSTASTYSFGTYGAEATGNINFVHNAGHLLALSFRKDSVFKGTVNITLNGLSKRSDSAGKPKITIGNNVVFQQAVQVIFNNGVDSNFASNALETATAKRGIWLMYGDEGGTLETTDTYGTFKAISDKTCYAVNKTTYQIYKSENGIITVPAGNYDIYYRDTEPDIELPYPDANEELNDAEGTVKEYLVYVAPEEEGGSNRNGDGTKEKPYRTIDKAMYHIASIKKETGVIKKGVIVLSGEAEFDGGEPHVNMITIRAANNTAKVVTVGNGNYDQVGNVTTLLGPTTFDGVMIKKTSFPIMTNGHELVITNGSERESATNGSDVQIYASQVDSPADNTQGETFTINSWTGSTWGGLNIHIGPVGNQAGKSIGKINAVINGGRFKNLSLLPGIYTDDVNFTWNGGLYTTDGPYNTQMRDYAEGSHTFKGAFQFIVNNDCGEYPTTQRASKLRDDGTPVYNAVAEEKLFTNVQAEKGEWFMYGAKGGRLAMTDTAGTFEVSAGTIATAVNRKTGNSYTSENGFLTVPEGFYDVTFEEDIEKAIYIDAMTLETETVGQQVRLENGKTYKFSFDYRNIENGLGNNVDVAVYSGKNILYSSALTGNKKIALESEANGTYHRVYEFTFGGTTGDYGVGFAINGSTLMRIYNPELIESSNATVNLYKNPKVKKNLENWYVSSKAAAADATEHSYTQGDAYVTIEIGEYYYSDYRKISSDAKALHIKSDGQFAIGTNVELKAGSTYRLIIENKGIDTDFYYDSYVVVRGAYGTDDTNEPFRTTNNNASNSTLPRISKDTQISRAVYEFTANYDGTYGIGVRVHSTANTKHLTEFFEAYIGNIALYDIGEPTKNLVKNSDFSDNLNGWYVAEHTEVANNTAHKITGTTDIKLDPAATSYGNPATDRDYIELVSMDKDFFKIATGDAAGTKNMVHIQNGAGWVEFLTRFKEENALKAGHTYVASYAISSDYDFDLDIRHGGNRDKVFESSINPINTEQVVGDGYSYKILTFEFTLPEEAYKGGTLSSEIYIGINMSASKAAWLFDFNLYDKADPRKTNLMPNPEFRSGLDNWIWGWKAWFEARSLGFGWTSWPPADNTEEGSRLDIAPYDFKNLISYKDDSVFNDGEWWDPDDVVFLEAQEEAGIVSGNIVDDKGNPLKNITVELKSSSDSSIVYTAKTDSNGFFEIKEVLVDVYKLTLISEDGSRREIPEYITVSANEIVTLNIKVAPAEIIVDSSTSAKKSTIKGTLYNSKRETLAGITVGVARNKTVVTDENGNFEFKDIPAGNYKIFAVNPDGSYYLLREYTLGEGQVVTLKLKYDPAADSATTQDMSTDGNDQDNDSGFPWWIFIVIGAVLILGAAAVIVIILLKKKKSESQTA